MLLAQREGPAAAGGRLGIPADILTTCPSLIGVPLAALPPPADVLMTLSLPGSGAAVQQDDLICFTCGANLPRREQTDEPRTPPAVMQESLRRDGATALSLALAACPLCGAAIPDRSML